MSLSDEEQTREAKQLEGDPIGSDRAALRIPGRYMLEDKRECPCVTRTISPTEIRIEAEMKPALNERVLVYLRDIGRIEGWTSHITPRGFALATELRDVQCTMLAALVKASDNSDSKASTLERRRHERLTPLHKFCALTVGEGEDHVVQLIDVSLSGAAFVLHGETLDRLHVGSNLLLGRRACRVVRRTADGAAIEFDRMLDPTMFDETIVL